MEGRQFVNSMYSSWAQGTALYVKWAALHDINYYELLVLYALHDKGALTQKTISEQYGLPKQTVNNVVRALKRENYILLGEPERDRREKLVSLTETGRVHAEQILTPLYELEERVCEGIGRERMSRMIETSDLFNLLFEREMERGQP